jgi:hypothetical protein
MLIHYRTKAKRFIKNPSGIIASLVVFLYGTVCLISLTAHSNPGEYRSKNYKNKRAALNKLVLKDEHPGFNEGSFSPNAKTNLAIANKVNVELDSAFTHLERKGVIMTLGIGVEAPEYYLINFEANPRILKPDHIASNTTVMRITKQEDNNYYIIGIGTGIVDSDPKRFAERFEQYIRQKFLPLVVKPRELKRILY